MKSQMAVFSTVLVTMLLAHLRPLHGQEAWEEQQLLRAIQLIEAGELAEAEQILTTVDDRDTNYWVRQFQDEHHFIAMEYLEVVARRRDGDASDRFFGSNNFRMLVTDLDLDGGEAKRILGTLEATLTSVTEWADGFEITRVPHGVVFVSIAPSFPTPSPARSLIFRWDRQGRSPRLELAAAVLNERLLELVLAHEITHVVLPHTNRPLAEGLANRVARQLTGRDLRFRSQRRTSPQPERWPLEEVLLYNVRTQGSYVQQANEAIAQGGFSPQATTIVQTMYSMGERLVDLIAQEFGEAKFLQFYQASNQDPAQSNILKVVDQWFGLETLNKAWLRPE